MTGLSLRFAARSEIGRVRRNNEDAGYAATDLLVVADGMGGHEAGELASAATIAAVVAAASTSVGADEVLNQLAEAVITSGEYIADVVAGNRDLAGMGTTMTVVALREDRIVMAHVGDSRAYVYRDSELQQMTKDHTFVQTLVDSDCSNSADTYETPLGVRGPCEELINHFSNLTVSLVVVYLSIGLSLIHI